MKRGQEMLENIIHGCKLYIAVWLLSMCQARIQAAVLELSPLSPFPEQGRSGRREDVELRDMYALECKTIARRNCVARANIPRKRFSPFSPLRLVKRFFRDLQIVTNAQFMGYLQYLNFYSRVNYLFHLYSIVSPRQYIRSSNQ